MNNESDAAIMSIAVALCDEFIESGLLNRESLSASLAAQSWALQQQQLPNAAGILETVREALTDEEKRAFRKKIKEQIGGKSTETVQ